MVLPLIARGVATALGSQALKQGAKQLLKSGAKQAAKGAAKGAAKQAAKGAAKPASQAARKVAQSKAPAPGKGVTRGPAGQKPAATEAKPAKTNKRGTNSRRSDGRFGPAPINSTYTPKPTMRGKAEDMARKALPIATAAAGAGAAADLTSDFMNTRGVNAGSVRSGQYARDKAAAAKPSAPAKSSTAPASTSPSMSMGKPLTAEQKAGVSAAAKDLLKPGPSSAKDYKSYAKSSDVAADFRRNFAAARKAGEKEFTWQGRKYSTKTK